VRPIKPQGRGASEKPLTQTIKGMAMIVDDVSKLLRYEPDTGMFFWRVDVMKSATAGSKAGKFHHGYIRIYINGEYYFAHRLAWLLIHKNWPSCQIDHINGNRADNRIANLRAVSHQGNQQNAARRLDNTSGVTGVCWDSRDRVWLARIKVNMKLLRLGGFMSFEDAVAARKSAEKVYGFHENHGREPLQISL